MASICPFDERERADLEFAKNWVSSGCGIFRISKPAIPDPHLVAYFLLLDSENQKILLVDHKNAELWLPAGGHVEVDEHPTETVRRELFEELSLQAEFLLPDPFFLTVTKTVGKTAGHTDVSLWYLLKGHADVDYTLDLTEFDEARWFSSDTIPFERSDPQMRRCIEKLKHIGQLASSC